jgi:hypothetical protein
MPAMLRASTLAHHTPGILEPCGPEQLRARARRDANLATVVHARSIEALVALLAAGMLLPGCADVVVGYFSTTDGTSASGTSEAGPSEVTTLVLDGTTLGATGETTTGGFVPPGCFSDDFADGVVDDPHWSSWAEADSYLEEAAGVLALTPPTYGLFDTGVVGRFDHSFPFESGWVRLRVVTAPPVDRPAGLFLMVADLPENLSIRLAGGTVQVAGTIDEQPVFDESFPFAPYPSWIGIRAEGSLAHFEISDDGQTWTTLATYDKPGPFDAAAALIMTQTFDAYPDRAAVSVDDLEVCVQ